MKFLVIETASARLATHTDAAGQKYQVREIPDTANIQGSGAALRSSISGLTAIPPAPIPIPESVTPLQFRRALTAAGLRDAVEAAVNAAGQAAKDTWDYASEIRRNDPTLTALAAGLGKTPAEIDAVFIAAAKL